MHSVGPFSVLAWDFTISPGLIEDRYAKQAGTYESRSLRRFDFARRTNYGEPPAGQILLVLQTLIYGHQNVVLP